jgi:hypothetical protein
MAMLGHADKWPYALGGAVVGHVAVAMVVKRAAARLLVAPFKAKGAPLRGARLQVHACAAVPARALAGVGAGGGCGDEEEDEDEERRDRPGWRRFELDTTVTPAAETTGPFRHWAPGELALVPVDADTGPDAARDECVAEVHGVQVFGDDGFVDDEGMSYTGPQRLRLTFSAAPGTTALKVQYYFEGFGRVDLP